MLKIIIVGVIIVAVSFYFSHFLGYYMLGAFLTGLAGLANYRRWRS